MVRPHESSILVLNVRRLKFSGACDERKPRNRAFISEYVGFPGMTGPTGGMNEIKTECERWGWRDDEAEVGSIGAVRCGAVGRYTSRADCLETFQLK